MLSFFFAIIRMNLFHFMIEIEAICYRMNIWKIVSKNKWCQIFSFCLFWCSRFRIVTGECNCTRNHIMRGKSSWTLFCVGPILNKRKLWLVTDKKRNVQKRDWICCVRWVIAVLIRNLKVKLCLGMPSDSSFEWKSKSQFIFLDENPCTHTGFCSRCYSIFLDSLPSSDKTKGVKWKKLVATIVIFSDRISDFTWWVWFLYEGPKGPEMSSDGDSKSFSIHGH